MNIRIVWCWLATWGVIAAGPRADLSLRDPAEPALSLPVLSQPPAPTSAATLEAKVQGLTREFESGGGAESLDGLIRARTALIDAAPDDPRQPTWLLDQAEAILRRAGRDGGEMSVLIGIPSRRQSRAMREAATQASVLARRADELIDGIVEGLQERVFRARGSGDEAVRAAAAEAESAMSRLLEIERAIRVPLIEGRAAVVDALCMSAEESARSSEWVPRLDLGLDLLDSVRLMNDAGQLRGEWARHMEWRRQITRAAGLAQMGDEASRLAGREAATAFRRALAESLQDSADTNLSNEEAASRVWYEVAGLSAEALCAAEGEREAAAVRLMRRLESELASVAREASNPNSRGAGREARVLLLGECVARMRGRMLMSASVVQQEVRASRDGQALHVNAACEGLIRALELSETEAWRGLIYDKIAEAVGPIEVKDSVAPALAFAAALRTLREALEDGQSRVASLAKMGSALQILRSVADRADAGTLRGDALWEAAAVALRMSAMSDSDVVLSRRMEAMRLLWRFIEEHPHNTRHAQAIESAAMLCLSMNKPEQQTPEKTTDDSGVAHEQDDETLRIAVMTRALDSGAAKERRSDLALALAELVWSRERHEMLDTAGLPIRAAASVGTAVRVLELLAQRVTGTAELDSAAERTDESLRIGGKVLVDVIQPAMLRAMTPTEKRQIGNAAARWARGRGDGWERLAMLPLAEAQVDEGESGAALAVLVDLRDTIAKQDGSATDDAATALRRSHARVRLSLGRAQRAAGQSTEAFLTLRSLAEDLDREPVTHGQVRPDPSTRREDEFWCAWAELVELIEADESNRDRTSDLRLQFNRLALIDPKFGSGECASRLEKIKAKLAK